MLDFPTDKTILVLASYRTGSTALCNLISKQTGLLNCEELFHHGVNPEYEKYRNRNQNIVVKIMPNQVPSLYWEELIKKSFVIGISRLSIREQIASFYLGHRTKHWHDFKKSNNRKHDYTIDIDRFDLEDQIRYILKITDMYQKQFVPLLNMEFKYEEIKLELAESDYVTYVKPINYEELLTSIDNLLPEIISWNLTND
jgi:LPS sulfotransferase NodH